MPCWWMRRWLIEWADRNSYNIYADGLVLRTVTPVSHRGDLQGTVTTEMRLTVLTRLLSRRVSLRS